MGLGRKAVSWVFFAEALRTNREGLASMIYYSHMQLCFQLVMHILDYSLEWLFFCSCDTFTGTCKCDISINAECQYWRYCWYIVTLGATQICGVIKQNQSEVSQIQFSSSELTVCTIFTATFCRKPHWNQSIGSKDMSSWRMPKTIGNKRHLLFWLGLS